MSLFATSAPMRRVVEDIARAAGQPAHVLLIGEAGTGRTLVAQAIHARSRDSAGPFVAVDCAQSPQDLEAQLFGSAGHRGPVERRTLERVRASAQLLQSKGGTLYLQNAVELPALDGKTILHSLRADPELSPVPIIGMSGHDIDPADERSFTCFLQKPFSPEDVVFVLAQVAPLQPAGGA